MAPIPCMPAMASLALSLLALVGCADTTSDTAGRQAQVADAPTGGEASAAAQVLVDMHLVGLVFAEGGYGVVSVSDRPGGNELTRGADRFAETAEVALDVTAGELEVRAWTHACEPSGCADLSDTELDALRPRAELCVTSVTVPPADSAQQGTDQGTSRRACATSTASWLPARPGLPAVLRSCRS